MHIFGQLKTWRQRHFSWIERLVPILLSLAELTALEILLSLAELTTLGILLILAELILLERLVGCMFILADLILLGLLAGWTSALLFRAS